MKTTRCQTFTILWLAISLVAAMFGSGCQGSSPAGAGRSRTGVQGQLIDRGGRPVSQFAIKIEGVENSSFSSVAVTDFSGAFQFFDVPSGKYKLYALKDSGKEVRLIDVRSGELQNIGTISLQWDQKVTLNKDAATNISPDAAKSINPDAAQTLNPEAARTINVEAAKMINPEAARTINSEAAKAINPEAAKTINSEAAKTLNPAAAKVINPERARVLTKEQALTITPAEAAKPVPTP
jgi:hypothetical protein